MSAESLTREEAMARYNGAYGYTGWNQQAADADYAATGGAGKGAGTSGGEGNRLLNLQAELNPQIDKYADELIEFANEDYNFAAKWLENQFKIALGNNDQERASFIKSVANELESRIGTIAYDYRTKTYRTERDRDIALARLEEDERISREELDITARKERETQGAELGARGILYGTREGATGLAGKNVRELEEDITRRYAALSRYGERERYNIRTTAEDTLADLMTAARRAAQEGQYAYTYGLESAERARERARLAAEGERVGVKSDLFGTLSNYFSNLTA